MVGFSTGSQQASQWAVSYPEMVGALAPICGAARTSVQNRLLLEGARVALTTSADYDGGWYPDHHQVLHIQGIDSAEDSEAETPTQAHQPTRRTTSAPVEAVV